MFTRNSPQLPIFIQYIYIYYVVIGSHRVSTGPYQDGGLLTYYPTERCWATVGLKFTLQATLTDGQGNPAA